MELNELKIGQYVYKSNYINIIQKYKVLKINEKNVELSFHQNNHKILYTVTIDLLPCFFNDKDECAKNFLKLFKNKINVKEFLNKNGLNYNNFAEFIII